jgi:hypothetical protein
MRGENPVHEEIDFGIQIEVISNIKVEPPMDKPNQKAFLISAKANLSGAFRSCPFLISIIA